MKKKVINTLELQLNNVIAFNENMDDKSWNMQIGIILSGNEAKFILDILKKSKP